MKNILIALVLSLLVLSCKDKKEELPNRAKETAKEVKVNKEEFKYVVNESFPIGDVRRYGIRPNQTINPKLIDNVLDIAEKGIEVYFPKGYYKTSLNINSRKNITLKFDDVELADVIHITNEKGTKSENIIFKGKLTTYDRFGTYYSNNINIDTLYIKSDSLLHLRKQQSRGCHIYTNTTNLNIKYLEIENLSSDDKNNHAALAIDGFPNYPKNISINEAIIRSSDRHGAYIMGFNHRINKLVINKFGQGNSLNMSGMQGADIGEEKLFSGVWFNECYNTEINLLRINHSEGVFFDINFDVGDKKYPIIINKVEYNGKIKKNKYSGEIIKSKV